MPCTSPRAPIQSSERLFALASTSISLRVSRHWSQALPRGILVRFLVIGRERRQPASFSYAFAIIVSLPVHLIVARRKLVSRVREWLGLAPPPPLPFDFEDEGE